MEVQQGLSVLVSLKEIQSNAVCCRESTQVEYGAGVYAVDGVSGADLGTDMVRLELTR